MGWREQGETYRLEMLRRLQQKNNRPPPAEVREAEKVIADYREKEERDRQAMTRLGFPLPKPELCPRCYYFHGRETALSPIPSDTDIDLLRCDVCSYETETD